MSEDMPPATFWQSVSCKPIQKINGDIVLRVNENYT